MPSFVSLPIRSFFRLCLPFTPFLPFFLPFLPVPWREALLLESWTRPEGDRAEEADAAQAKRAAIAAEGAVKLAETIHAKLRKDKGRVIDLFHAWNADGDGAISKPEFVKGVLPYIGKWYTPEQIETMFDAFDNDGSGCLDYRELYAAAATAAY